MRWVLLHACTIHVTDANSLLSLTVAASSSTARPSSPPSTRVPHSHALRVVVCSSWRVGGPEFNRIWSLVHGVDLWRYEQHAHEHTELEHR
jgi:hypothetical protein